MNPEITSVPERPELPPLREGERKAYADVATLYVNGAGEVRLAARTVRRLLMQVIDQAHELTLHQRRGQGLTQLVTSWKDMDGFPEYLTAAAALGDFLETAVVTAPALLQLPSTADLTPDEEKMVLFPAATLLALLEQAGAQVENLLLHQQSEQVLAGQAGEWLARKGVVDLIDCANEIREVLGNPHYGDPAYEEVEAEHDGQGWRVPYPPLRNS